MLRLTDATDNRGRGWRQLTREELREQVAMWLLLIPLAIKKRHATGGDEQKRQAQRQMTDAIRDRLEHYPIFGPERPAEGHTAGGYNQVRDRSDTRPA
jgi:hypothetical protein